MLMLLINTLFTASSGNAVSLEMLKPPDLSYIAHYTVKTSGRSLDYTHEYLIKYDMPTKRRYVKRTEYDSLNNITQETLLNINGIRDGRVGRVTYDNDNRKVFTFEKSNELLSKMLAHDVPQLWYLLRPPELTSQVNVDQQHAVLRKIQNNNEYSVVKNVMTNGFSITILSSANASFRRVYTFSDTLRYPLSHSLSSDSYSENVSIHQENNRSFPSKITYAIGQSGKTSTTVVTIHKFDPNPSFTNSDFSIDSMGLRTGTLIAYPELLSINDYPIWDGSSHIKVFQDEIDSQAFAAPTPTTPKPSLISQAWPYFLGFVVFAILGFWLIRKQRQASKEV